MDTYTVEILEPKAEKLLDDLANLGLFKLRKVKSNKKSSKLDRREFYLSAPVMTDEEYENYQQARDWMNQWRQI